MEPRDAMDEARERMVDRQLRARGIADPRLIDAFRAVPRELFVAGAYRRFAYDDGPLPIAAGQTISQPYIVAEMIAAAGIDASSRVLEVGCGSGYAAAVLARLAARVLTIDRHSELVEAAVERFAMLRSTNVDARVGDGTLGWPEAAPFDAILVAAAGPAPPPALKAQLTLGGRLVMPVGSADGVQQLVRLTRHSAADFEEEALAPVRFVPLIGVQGWPC
jgi:protein-L-isoaspartate(D-aspartate) O-methyltransferase